jgi:hypothetical protein
MVWPIIKAVSQADMLGGELGQVKRGRYQKLRPSAATYFRIAREVWAL